MAGSYDVRVYNNAGNTIYHGIIGVNDVLCIPPGMMFAEATAVKPVYGIKLAVFWREVGGQTGSINVLKETYAKVKEECHPAVLPSILKYLESLPQLPAHTPAPPGASTATASLEQHANSVGT